MKAILISQQSVSTNVSESLRLVEDWPEPAAPEPGEVLIRTEYSALNHMDIWIGKGIPGVSISYPHIGGVEAVGKVEALGEGVDKSWLGKRVVHNAAVVKNFSSEKDLAPEYELIGEHSFGCHRELYIIPVENLVDIGDADGVQVAAFGLCGLTAYSMMFSKGNLKKDHTVLITGIGGGVATASLQLALHSDCETIVTSRHKHKLEKAKQLGAHHLILDEGEDWSWQVRKLTNKRGVDMAVDSNGTASHLYCVKSLARGGVLVLAGATSGAAATTDLGRIFWNQLRVLGSTMGSNHEFRQVMALFLSGKVKAVIDKVYPWQDAVQAWERLEASEQMGKLVLDWRSMNSKDTKQ